MSEVGIRYHDEPAGWWADSPDLPGFSAAGDTLEEVRRMAAEGAVFATGEPVKIVEEGVPSQDPN